MKNNSDDRLLERKRQIDAERRERAIARRRQTTLRDTVPGMATPASVMRFMKQRQMDEATARLTRSVDRMMTVLDS